MSQLALKPNEWQGVWNSYIFSLEEGDRPDQGFTLHGSPVHKDLWDEAEWPFGEKLPKPSWQRVLRPFAMQVRGIYKRQINNEVYEDRLARFPGILHQSDIPHVAAELRKAKKNRAAENLEGWHFHNHWRFAELRYVMKHGSDEEMIGLWMSIEGGFPSQIEELLQGSRWRVHESMPWFDRQEKVLALIASEMEETPPPRPHIWVRRTQDNHLSVTATERCQVLIEDPAGRVEMSPSELDFTHPNRLLVSIPPDTEIEGWQVRVEVTTHGRNYQNVIEVEDRR